ncbi:MAG: thiol:disulfide interchange protein [Bdellovibrio sp.]|nr:MAG: thiol:disulfide interchange protein [Bdellovibrio sp.]
MVFEAIKKDPKGFLDTVNEAVSKAKEQAYAEQEKKMAAQMEEEFKNPKKPKIDEGRVFWGTKDAPVTIVEYSDFLCPYCARAHVTLTQLLEKYKGKIRIFYKHYPNHRYSMESAQYFEAVALQDHEKARKFHDYLYEHQRELYNEGIPFLDKAVKKVGANLKKVKKDIEKESIKKRIREDKEEAIKFGFNGTPGFLINGVSVNGALPIDHFSKIIDRHLKGK